MSLTCGTIFFLQKRHSITHRWVWLFFLCIALTFSKSWADIIEYLPLSLTLEFIYPLCFISIPILFFFYIYNFTTNNQDPSRWWYMLFLLPILQFLISGYIFFVHYPLAEIQHNFYLITTFNAHSLFQLAQKVQSITLFLAYLCMFLVMLASFFFVARIELDKDKEARKAHELARNRFLLLLCISFALFLGSSFYQLKKEELGWIQWLMIPGLLLIGVLIYLIRLPEHVICQKQIISAHDHRRTIHLDRRDEELKTYFENERPWLNPDLKEIDVARHLAISTSYLSEILNIYHHTNFRDFINSYRVDEFKKLFISGQRKSTIEYLAERVGFKDYLTFLRAFKKNTGITPRQYIRKYYANRI